MGFKSNIIIDLYSILLLVVIYIHARKHIDIVSLQQKLYMSMVQVAAFMLVLDVFSRFDGHLGTLYPAVNHVGNFLIFLFSPVIPCIWMLYAHHEIYHDDKTAKRLLIPLLGVNAVNVALVVLSQFFGWLYAIDGGNIYHRGPLFFVPVVITLALILAASAMIVANRAKIEKKHYFALVFFAVPPIVCIVLQVLFYGISLMLNSVVLSILIVFFNIQNESMNTDYLTGVYNRKKLEVYIKEKIHSSSGSKTFSAILLDLDNFKAINDTYGHDMGDDALEASVMLLKSCLRADDFIARFGGDEFYIILDVSNAEDLEAAIGRINSNVIAYNQHSTKPYRLTFSMGYAVYDSRSRMTSADFKKHIDQLMYANKRANKVAL